MGRMRTGLRASSGLGFGGTGRLEGLQALPDVTRIPS